MLIEIKTYANEALNLRVENPNKRLGHRLNSMDDKPVLYNSI